MTQTTINHSLATRPSLPLRRVDGIELPVAGAWTMPGHHATIAFSVPRRRRRPESRSGRASEATVFIGEDPDDVRVAVRFDAPGVDITGSPAGTIGPPIHLEARSVPGRRRWALSGELLLDTGVVPVRATLGYHGVWRRGGDHIYGWFVLAGTIGEPGRKARPLEFRFELLATAPDVGSPPVPAPSRSRSLGDISRTAGAA